MLLLISGPPASGKSRILMDRFLAQADSLLLVPTATMADHTAHSLTRAAPSLTQATHSLAPTAASRVGSGALLASAGRIRTLAQFVDEWSPLQPAPPALVYRLLEQALANSESADDPFAAVAELPGFLRSLTSLFGTGAPQRFPEHLARPFRAVDRQLAAAGLGGRHARLSAAAERIGLGDAKESSVPGNIFLDGFFSFSPGELLLIEALATRTQLTIALPDWPGAARSRDALLSSGFSEQLCSGTHRASRKSLLAPPTIEHEAEAIAHRILSEAAKGRPFRDMGIVLRVRDPYAPLLETTLARFGIPARAYFTDPLKAHPAIVFLSTIVRSLLERWDNAALLEALRMPVAGLGATPEGDHFDFALRDQLPGQRVHLTKRIEYRRNPDRPRRRGNRDDGLPAPRILTRLAEILTRVWEDPWGDATLRKRLAPAEWADRLRSFVALLPSPAVTDRVSRDQIYVWRSTACALRGFDAALEQTSLAIELTDAGKPTPCTLAEFWRQLETVLALEPLRVPDDRRNVVHILDAYEARQWELPIVFVCGLTERHFPQYHREDPILGDLARRQAGLDTSLDLQNAERFLFDLAATRATEETILSYPVAAGDGEATLRSFFLDTLPGEVTLPREPASGRGVATQPPRYHPTPASPVTGPKRTSGQPSLRQSAEIRKLLADRHRALSPSSIESYLQCPFQFFAQKTLRLNERPPAPRDRLDMLLQGSILHRALAEWTETPLLGTAVLDQVFHRECAARNVPATYRTEAVRLELLRHFTAFVADQQLVLDGWTQRVELSFEFPLNNSLAIRGRIDRLEIGPRGDALVIDYKYSAPGRIKEKIEESDAGNLVQGGLYLLAAQRHFGLDPAGMLYCGLKKGVTWGGWHRDVAGLRELGESRTPEALAELIQDAEQTALRVHKEIGKGRIDVAPQDSGKCRYCDARAICRVETIPIPSSASRLKSSGGPA